MWVCVCRFESVSFRMCSLYIHIDIVVYMYIYIYIYIYIYTHMCLVVCEFVYVCRCVTQHAFYIKTKYVSAVEWTTRMYVWAVVGTAGVF